MPFRIDRNTVIATLCLTSAGLFLIGSLIALLKRKKTRHNILYAELTAEFNDESDENAFFNPDKLDFSFDDCNETIVAKRTGNYNTLPNFRSRHTNTMRKSNSIGSLISDANSTLTITGSTVDKEEHCPPAQLIKLGLDLVVKAKSRWQLALHQLEMLDEPDETDVELQQQLKELMMLCNKLEETASLGLEGEMPMDQLCTTVAMDAALEEMDREFELQRRRNKSIYADSSSGDSFYTAVADLSDLDEQKVTFQHLELYEKALNELTAGNIPYRILRTKMANCSSDTEFLAKLYCIRLAFNEILSVEENRIYFADLGRDLISSLLRNANKDVDEFIIVYDDMLAYVFHLENWVNIDEELQTRGVKVMNFFDIVIDFLLFDAFEDLDNPPNSLIAILNNRWLTNGFKETALLTAVWSVLKAKRTMLKFPNRFMSLFYSISEITSPVLAWGFLGPDGPLKNMCNYFKDQVMCFVHDAFDFDRVNYMNVDRLATDIITVAKERASVAKEKLSLKLEHWEMDSEFL